MITGSPRISCGINEYQWEWQRADHMVHDKSALHQVPRQYGQQCELVQPQGSWTGKSRVGTELGLAMSFLGQLATPATVHHTDIRKTWQQKLEGGRNLLSKGFVLELFQNSANREHVQGQKTKCFKISSTRLQSVYALEFLCGCPLEVPFEVLELSVVRYQSFKNSRLSGDIKIKDNRIYIHTNINKHTFLKRAAFPASSPKNDYKESCTINTSGEKIMVFL